MFCKKERELFGCLYVCAGSQTWKVMKMKLDKDNLYVSDIRCHVTSEKGKPAKMNRGECYVRTPCKLDGFPVAQHASFRLSGPFDVATVEGMEQYILLDGCHEQMSLSDYGKKYAKNVEDYIGISSGQFDGTKSVEFDLPDGTKISREEMNRQVREFLDEELQKPHMMSFEEYTDWREVHKNRYGEMEADDYISYLEDIGDKLQKRHSFVGNLTLKDVDKQIEESKLRILNEYYVDEPMDEDEIDYD